MDVTGMERGQADVTDVERGLSEADKAYADLIVLETRRAVLAEVRRRIHDWSHIPASGPYAATLSDVMGDARDIIDKMLDDLAAEPDPQPKGLRARGIPLHNMGRDEIDRITARRLTEEEPDPESEREETP